MNSEPPDSNACQDDLQFDPAESADDRAAGALICAACGQPIESSYYEIDGQVHCDACREELEAARLGGSRAARVARATLLGVLAGALGAAIYYAVAALTGYEIGLVALVVGLLVGGAVRLGSKARGGWFYQGLAMFLTYAAVGVSYGLFMAQAIAEDPSLLDPNTPAVTTAPAAGARETGALAAAESQPAEDPNGSLESLSTGEKVAGIGIALAFIAFVVLALPIVAGLEAPLGLLILGIALYEAWKINRRRSLHVAGPYTLGTDGPDHLASAPRGGLDG